jgi:hypothetical protein
MYLNTLGMTSEKTEFVVRRDVHRCVIKSQIYISKVSHTQPKVYFTGNVFWLYSEPSRRLFYGRWYRKFKTALEWKTPLCMKIHYRCVKGCLTTRCILLSNNP